GGFASRAHCELVVTVDPRIVAPPVGDRARGAEGAGTEAGGLVIHPGGREHSGGDLLAFVEVTTDLPEPPGRGEESEGRLGVAPLDGPVQRGPEVVVVELETIEPSSAHRPGQLVGTTLDQAEIGRCVPVAEAV